MKLQQTPNLNVNNQKQNTRNGNSSKVAFAGGELLTSALTYLQTNQGLGASFVDAAFMCTPRTIVDFTRSPEAGVETARREFSSNINDAVLGGYGIGAAWILSQGFNKKYDVKANKMPVDKDMIDTLSEIRYKSGDINKTENLKTYLNEIFDRTKCFNPNAKINKNGWVEINKTTRESVVEKLTKDLQASTPTTAKEAKANLKATKAYLKALLVSDTGTEGDFKIERTTINPKTNKEEIIKSASAVDDFIDDVFKVSKAFMSDKVAPLFKSDKILDVNLIKKEIEGNKFLKEFKGLKMGTAALGIATCCAIGASVQPINMYLTKKKTGQTGFVGGGKEDKSNKFKILKTGAALLGGAALIRTIGKFSEVPSKIQFKGIWPTIPQFKLVYAITIISRLLSARNENELRESCIKDSLGFANWLILGGFVSKLVALGFEKLPKFKNNGEKFIKYNAVENSTKNGKALPKWLAGSVVTREEVLHEALKKAGVDVIKDGKAMDFKEMLKVAAEKAPAARTKTRYLGVVQAAGYLWSALALGIAVPKINIAITKAVEKKQKVAKKEVKDLPQTEASAEVQS